MPFLTRFCVRLLPTTQNQLEVTGELVILERPGETNLYFVAWDGKPLGGTSAERPGEHDRRCPVRDPGVWDRCARCWPDRFPPRDAVRGGSGISDPPTSLDKPRHNYLAARGE